MSQWRIKKKIKRAVYSEYYQRPFAHFHEDSAVMDMMSRRPHPKRESFWDIVLPGRYSSGDGRDLVLQYLNSVESDLGAVLAKHSVAYFLHLYRRIAPRAVGRNQHPTTVLFIRAILEAAVQKYATFELCGRVGSSDEVPFEQVLRGALVSNTDAAQQAASLSGPPNSY